MQSSEVENYHYDYIIAGGGLSGLSLAYRIIHSPLSKKKILVIDKTLQPTNNKTWSFWHSGTPPFVNLTHKQWRKIKIVFEDRSILETLKKYRYYSIRSGQFRKDLLKELREHPSVDLLEASIVSLRGDGSGACLQTQSNTYRAGYIFQSCFTPPQLAADSPRYPLIQHFLGMEIKAHRDVFDASVVTLMDFDFSYRKGVAFVYILPWSARRALVEYTVFSDAPAHEDFYREKLSLYLFNKYNLRAIDYQIDRIETGRIPMQDHIYVPRYAPRVINMGSAGGLTKPSTGYTFSRIQEHVQAIVENLCKDMSPALMPQSPVRYRSYDLWLLQIIYAHPATALQIFRQLFSNNSIDNIFQFLDEDNTLAEDLKTMSKVSYRPFFEAMWQTRKRLAELI